MKLKKKTTMIVSFTLGALLMTTTALADIVNKNGYEQLKDSLKITAENCTEKYDNFTLDLSFVVKDNEKVLTSENQVTKQDNRTSAKESISNRQSPDGEEYASYYYTDKTTDISKGNDGTYYVTEYAQEREFQAAGNPFKEKQAEDVERIADALVGSLKDHVAVKENTDGSKELSGSLSEVQIPSLFNALASFQMKQEFNGRQNNMPNLTEDIYIKEVTGTALINKEGVLENMLATATLAGKDTGGQTHDISIEILLKVKDINATTVAKPNLAGKTVVKQEGKISPSQPGLSNPEKFIGKYKNDILIEKDGKFVKIGERYLDITQLDNNGVSGNYYEEYKEGYDSYASQKRDFAFQATFNKDSRNAEFQITGESNSGINGNIYIDEYTAKIHFYLNLPYRELGYDPMFSPVLD